MFERFTGRARRVMVLVQEEARMPGHDIAGRIRSGLMHEGAGLAVESLRSRAAPGSARPGR